MKNRTLFLIRFAVILPALLCVVLLAACSARKKEPLAEQQKEEFLAQVEQTKKDEVLNTIQDRVQGNSFDFISIPEGKAITLTNGEAVNHVLFPVRIDHFQEYIGLEGPPYYLESADDWVVFTSDRRDGGMHGLTLHLKNLPQEFDVLIYTPGEGNCLKFSGEKIEFNIEEYRDFFVPEQRESLERILPMYTFYYPAPFTSFPEKQKTEIRGKDTTLIFSTYLDYPDDPFRIYKLGGRSFSVQYCTDTPFYLVVYEATFDAILSADEEGYERIPVGAFAVHPKTDIWEGTLSFGPRFDGMDVYRIYLYRLDENNPDDCTQAIEGSWNNFIDLFGG